MTIIAIRILINSMDTNMCYSLINNLNHSLFISTLVINIIGHYQGLWGPHWHHQMNVQLALKGAIL
jgi:hypothetical protein